MTTSLFSSRRLLAPPPALLLALLLMPAGLLVALSKDPGIYRFLVGSIYIAVLSMIAAHDARTHRAPNRIVYPALGFAVLASLTLGWADAQQALLGGVLAFAIMLVIAVAGRGAMGYGDVKVGALCGIVVGLHGVLPMLLLTFVVGAAVAVVLLLLRLRRRKDSIAFTPFVVGATLFSMAYFHLYLWS